MKKIFIVFALIAGILFSCSVEKRVYRSGYNVQWREHVNATKNESKNEVFQVNPFIETKNKSLKTYNSNQFNPNSSSVNHSDSKEIQRHSFDSSPVSLSSTTSELSTEITSKEMMEMSADQQKESGDNLLYWSAALMALSTFGLLKLNRKKISDLTRWAKKNPKKAQWSIALMQFALLCLALFSGYNLRQLGYFLSDTFYYVFGAIMALGFALTPFKRKANSIQLPSVLNRARLGYLGVIISSLMMTTTYGNQIEEKHSDSTIASVLKSTDKLVFADDYSVDHNTSKIGCKCESARKGDGFAICALAVFLTLLLLVTLCAGICLMVFGIQGIGAGAIVSGFLIAAASVYLIFLSIRWCVRSNKKV